MKFFRLGLPLGLGEERQKEKRDSEYTSEQRLWKEAKTKADKSENSQLDLKSWSYDWLRMLWAREIADLPGHKLAIVC